MQKHIKFVSNSQKISKSASQLHNFTTSQLHRRNIMQMEDADLDFNAESRILHDKKGKWTAMFVCLILGTGTLFTFTSMAAAADYYTRLFPNYHPIRIFTVAYQPFCLVFVSILAHNEARINTRLRILAGYTIFFWSSLGIIILDLAVSGKGGIGHFIGLCMITIAFGLADALVQPGMVGDLSLMCPEFVQSYLAGLPASGVITSVIRLITKGSFEHTKNGFRKGALMFFGITCLFELVCLVLYAYVFPKLPIVKYYRSNAALEGCKTVAADLSAAGVQYSTEENVAVTSERLTNIQLLWQNKDYALGIFLLYVLTFSIYPGFLSEDTGSHSLGSWYALILINMYSSWNLIGRVIPLIKYLKITSRKWVVAAVLSRYIFIPAFYFAANYGGQGWVIMLTSMLGLSNGHLTVCIVTEAPNKGYKSPEKNALGNLLIVCVLAGIFLGVLLDWLWLIGKKW